MKEQIEKLIQSYRGQIKNYTNCGCRSACNCDEVGRYINTVYKKVIEDLQHIVNPPVCMICNGTNGLTKFQSSSLYGYICQSCLEGPNTTGKCLYEIK